MRGQGAGRGFREYRGGKTDGDGAGGENWEAQAARRMPRLPPGHGARHSALCCVCVVPTGVAAGAGHWHQMLAQGAQGAATGATPAACWASICCWAYIMLGPLICGEGKEVSRQAVGTRVSRQASAGLVPQAQPPHAGCRSSLHTHPLATPLLGAVLKRWRLWACPRRLQLPS